MTVWRAGRESRLLDQILVGDKTIEGRLNRGKFAEYAVGDKVWLRRDFRDESGKLHDGEPDQLLVTIVSIKHYSNFHVMFKHENYKRALPEASSKDDAENLYQHYYSSDEQKKYGVLAIHISL